MVFHYADNVIKCLLMCHGIMYSYNV